MRKSLREQRHGASPAEKLERYKRDWACDYARINRLPVEAVLQHVGLASANVGTSRSEGEGGLK